VVIHWPKRIKAKGELRHQYSHSVDVVPTILECVGLELPKAYRGVEQWPLSGVSMKYTFDAKPDDPTRKHHQYYAMLGTRGMWVDGWKAVALHAPFTSKGHFDKDQWELYHAAEDRSESKNLAKEKPDKLQELIKAWLHETVRPQVPMGGQVLSVHAKQVAEAGKYGTYFRVPAKTRESSLQLHLDNGSRIIGLPASEGKIRVSSSVALLIIDEASRVEECLYRAMRPMLAVSRERLIALSTPFGKRGWFHEAWQGAGDWERVKVTAEQCPRIAADLLAEERRALSERWFRQEYLCSFEDVVVAVFAYADIHAALSDGTVWRLWGRERAVYTARYPELDQLRLLPAGTLVDGELVAFDDYGRPDLRQLLRRHGFTDRWRIRRACQWGPVQYVLFDLLYNGGRCLMREPLVRRREVLAEACERLDAKAVLFSSAMIGAGTALYRAVVSGGQEGVMAKQLMSVWKPASHYPRTNPVKEMIPARTMWAGSRLSLHELSGRTAFRDDEIRMTRSNPNVLHAG
jgi:hypothetical protein